MINQIQLLLEVIGSYWKLLESIKGKMAERQGFEPWDGINRRWFSRPVLSTTQPPLRKKQRQVYLADSIWQGILPLSACVDYLNRFLLRIFHCFAAFSPRVVRGSPYCLFWQ